MARLICGSLRCLAGDVNNQPRMAGVSGTLRAFWHRQWIIPAVELGDYLPIQEAAKLYSTSDDTLYRLLSAGRLKRFRREMDKRTWLKRSELDAIFKPKAVDKKR
jgi:excisionase family DNA binding protein